ncbi:hypothetical protein [Aliamphritea ceti]|uniref:hypothetical protein n=1 Tax=Aliamphritea ceti TaxID=1524258 RepID=UPI0021C26C87|nr:hypothetical protein [Aliamphritea ceti]
MAFSHMAVAALAFAPVAASAEDVFFEVSGKVAGQLQGFTEDGQFSGQNYDTNLSFSIEPEFYWEWNDGEDSVVFEPFYRYDEQDSERTHGDIRELNWLRVGDGWEFRAGLGKVFWGVTEFQHLADVINQTDGVDSFDGEEKLGQPMLNLSLVYDWGIVDAFILPGFRERTFAGQDGRLRSGLVVNTDAAEYESAAEEKHVDLALRWSHSIDVFDVGVYWFRGTNREPILQARSFGGQTELVPVYQQIDQIGFDGQATIDSWLWKLETIVRDSKDDRYAALQGGLEYTFYGISETNTDLGLLLEYGWDERGKNATSAAQNDIFLGTRFTLNDEVSTEILLGGGIDADYGSRSFFIEASRRVGEDWKVSLDGRFFSADKASDPAVALAEDDRIQLTVERYF